MEENHSRENNLRENLKRCSRCAICAEVCPVFHVCKSEVALTRGKFTQLLGVLKGDLKFSKKIKKNLNLCLNCGKCFKFCPSNIDAVQIFSEFKYKNLSLKDRILSSEFIFNLKVLPFNVFKRRYKEKEDEIHFFGCISKYKNGFKCCGMPYLTKGRLDIYEKLITHNIHIASNPKIKKIIFHCATCYDTFKKYPIPDAIARKLVFEPDFKIPNKPFTFHKPCHMDDITYKEINEKLKENKNYIELEPNDCCGFGGDFFLKHPLITLKLAVKKARKIKESGAKTVITSCPVCSFGLKIGKIINGCIGAILRK